MSELSPRVTRVVVELDSTGFVTAYADQLVDLVILDHSVIDSPTTITVEGIQVAYNHVQVDLDDDQCYAVFRELEDHEDTLNVSQDLTS